MARLIDADELLRRIRIALNGKCDPQEEVCYQWLNATIDQLADDRPDVTYAELDKLRAENAKLELVLGDAHEELQKLRNENAILHGVRQTIEVIFGRSFGE